MKRELRYRELSIVRVVANLATSATKLALAFASTRGAPELAIWCFALGPVASARVTRSASSSATRGGRGSRSAREVAARAARFTAAVQGGELLYYAYTSADYLVVGAWFGDAAVGAYRLAYELVLDVVRLLSMITAEVAFPTFVRLAREPAAVGAQLVRFTRQNLIVIAPFLVLVAVEADDLLALLYPPLPAAAATAARVLARDRRAAHARLHRAADARRDRRGAARARVPADRRDRAAVAFVLAVTVAPGARVRVGRGRVEQRLPARVRGAARDGAAARAADRGRVRARARRHRGVRRGRARRRLGGARRVPEVAWLRVTAVAATIAATYALAARAARLPTPPAARCA